MPPDTPDPRLSAALLESRARWRDLALLSGIRATVAEAVAALPNVPRDLVLRLARDTAVEVAGPVLRLSPLLSEADLLALVAAPPAAFTRSCLAARRYLA